MATATPTSNLGRVIEITGPVLVCKFPEESLPPINQALRVVSTGFDLPEPMEVIVEVQQHLGEGRVKCIAMQATDGLVRGMQAIDTGGPIMVPVGNACLGRVMNVVGEPVDKLGPIQTELRSPIRRPAPRSACSAAPAWARRSSSWS